MSVPSSRDSIDSYGRWSIIDDQKRPKSEETGFFPTDREKKLRTMSLSSSRSASKSEGGQSYDSRSSSVASSTPNRVLSKRTVDFVSSMREQSYSLNSSLSSSSSPISSSPSTTKTKSYLIRDNINGDSIRLSTAPKLSARVNTLTDLKNLSVTLMSPLTYKEIIAPGPLDCLFVSSY